MSIVGLVGLGAMGSRIAGRLLEAGNQVHGTNRTRSKAQPLVERGLVWQDSPRAVAAAAEMVLSMVTDDAALRAVTEGPDGILAGLSPGAVYIDLSSVSPHASVRVADHVHSLGARMLDAPVSGSVPQAEAGTLAIMVGADEDAFQRAQPLLRQLGDPVTRVGGNGRGVLLKLAINISLAAQTLAFSEGLLLAERGGIDPRLAAQVMTTSPIGSPMLAARAPLILKPPEDAWFNVALMHKDIGLALEEAQRLHVPLPSAVTADHLLATADRFGYGHRDIVALHDVLGRLIAQPAQREKPATENVEVVA